MGQVEYAISLVLGPWDPNTTRDDAQAALRACVKKLLKGELRDVCRQCNVDDGGVKSDMLSKLIDKVHIKENPSSSYPKYYSFFILS